MKIRQINITNWRHFENISLEIDGDAPLVCIVGANGTGKSHILELIASCAHELGLSPGVDIPRGNVFSDEHEVGLTFYLAPGVSETVDLELASDPLFALWDRTLEITSIKNSVTQSRVIKAGGLPDENQQTRFAGEIIQKMRQNESVHFLSLDADRAYPKKNINVNQMAEAYGIDWGGSEYTKGRSFRTSATLYDEWLKYFLASENQAGSKLMQAIRRATKAGTAQPQFSDHFESFALSVQKVLPHMTFTGVDTKNRTLLFDTTGLQLSFDQLSGGEREIAFQIGQIDRFGLRQGLFLLDEPELHLNADLIRQWVTYLTGTVLNGQIWLATHSLEAVEAAGPNASFVLERNDVTRKVDSIARLDNRPIITALSRAVGTPAFSISQLKFVYIEGEERLGERERFRKLCGLPANVRFMEGGSCTEVQRRLADVKGLASTSGVGIRIGGIIDKDFRKGAALATLTCVRDLFVLPVMECENLFLDPRTLTALLAQNGKSAIIAQNIIQVAADARAGGWIFQYAMATQNADSLPAIPARAKDEVKAMAWADFEADVPAACTKIAAHSAFDTVKRVKLQKLLEIGAAAYRKVRVHMDLWKECEGKQVLVSIAPQAGFSGPDALIQASIAAWERDAALLPAEVASLRTFVDSL